MRIFSRLTPLTRRRLQVFFSQGRARLGLVVLGFTLLFSMTAELWSHQKPLVLVREGKWYFPILRNTPAAEEVLQDAMMKIWNKATSYDPAKGNLINWCLQIARNAAIDRLRLKRINTTTELIENVSQQLQTASLNPETIGVRELLVTLQPEHRDILELLYFQGYSQSEAAEALNIPLGTLKTRCYAAINQLSALFT
jgi:RNA polymerase sigma-70 factor (ECF subfamily)